MSTDREPFDTLVALAPPAPVDPAGLERAHARATATIRSGGTTRLQAVARRRVRSHRIVGATVLAVTAATVSVVVPSLDLGSTGDTGPAPLFWGVQPAAAEAAGCLNTLMPVPAPVEPETLVARDAWATIPAISRALWTIPGRTLSHADVRQSPAACGAVPIAVLYDTDPQRGITVYRDVAPVFPGEPNLFDPVTVQGHPGQVLTAAAQVHHLTWVDGSGVRWYVDAHGVSVDQLVTVLDDSLDADGLAAVPEGFTSARLPAPDPSATVYRWSARYTDGSYLEVTTPHRTAVQRGYSRTGLPIVETTVGGWPAIYLPQQQGVEIDAELRWSDGTSEFRLGLAGASLAELQHLAASLTQLAPDDPALTAAH